MTIRAQRRLVRLQDELARLGYFDRHESTSFMSKSRQRRVREIQRQMRQAERLA